ncbi:Sugar kinase of the NBD/HSP70 family, may contain an N-terminal HTH domain [Actinacidiphila yanglinensis]|uniref:Sugar kinase of the NBD/HSP70 family, may contain an N-terminal HTH domain n=1 Tax=Actinacidiphila yanglinensis TaxID=310779 RepID=A0A1H6C8S1_9ACTN|nr:ROK family transcriptional regulator [Actinacidiphila yanglinensis]SEG69293.1 Sugar kinase of the NBD/HSP70 family, may contain an N-terminal HTH domain [Actinacidiphila yanglinensis]
MNRTGTNLPAVGEYNQTVVLDAIRRRPEGITRSELAALTALSGMTVTKVCRRLLDAGLVDEQGRRNSGPGKPAAVVKLNPSGGFAVGVHIDPAAVTYVLVDLSGTVRDHSRTGTPTAGDPSAVIDEMANAIEALIAGSAVDRSRILGIGIASPGPVNVEEGLLLNPPMMPTWHQVALRRALAEATGLPVLLEKDTTAAVVAELWFADPTSSRDFAFMYYGTGLGTGLSVAGEVVRGIGSNAGDAGHITVDPEGEVCACGRRGCVGHITVPRTLVQQAVHAGVLTAAEAGSPDSTVDVDAAFTRLAALAAAGDAGAGVILTGAAQALARAIVVIVNLLDIDEVIFGGPFWARVSPAILAALPGAVHADPALIPPHPIRFAQSAIPVDVAAVGAATLVLDNTFSPRPSALLLATE